MSGEGQDPTQEPGQDPKQQIGNGSGAGSPAEPKQFNESYVTKLRGEAANWRTQFKDAQAELDKLKQAQMSDLEKAQADAAKANKLADDMRAQFLESQRVAAISQAAAGKFPVDAALKLADVTIDENGKVSGADAAIELLVKTYPGMVPNTGTPVGNGSPANPNRPKTNTKKSLDDFTGKSPEYINAHWDEYKEALAKQN